jgi:hypothetical protein
MSYQNVASCRFYIDYFSYWKSVGLVHALKSWDWNGNYHDGYFIGLNPSLNTRIFTGEVLDIEGGADAPEDKFVIAVDLKEAVPNRVLDSINFCGVLGHNINVYSDEINGCEMQFLTNKRDAMDSQIGQHTPMGTIDSGWLEGEPEIINAERDDAELKVGNSGFSLSKVEFHANTSNYDDTKDEVDRFAFRMQWRDPSGYIIGGESSDEVISGDWNLNCLTMGHYYEMPRSPDLNLTMTTEFDGFDQLTTQGGATITNVRYTGNPQWAGNNAWEIGDSNKYYKRNGRRTWKLKFSYLDATDVFASNYSSNTYLQNGTHSSNDDYHNNNDLNSVRDAFEYTLADDDSFGAKVLNFIGSGQRFIFQPDNTNNNPDQFAICILDQDSLVLKQTASNVYDVSMKIVEVW